MVSSAGLRRSIEVVHVQSSRPCIGECKGLSFEADLRFQYLYKWQMVEETLMDVKIMVGYGRRLCRRGLLPTAPIDTSQ